MPDALLTTRWVLAALFVVGPGLFAWWRGRRLIRHLGEPAFAERYARYRTLSGQILVVAVVVALFVPPRYGPWFAALVIPAALLGGFSAHKQIHEESWGAGAYLIHWMRVVAVGFGPWLLALLSPQLYQALGAGAFAVALSITLAIAWAVFLAPAAMRGLGAQPLPAGEHRTRFETIVERSTGPAPSLWTGGPEGGRFVNGLAVPGSPPAVLMTRDLLDALSPDEADAIFAHEMAHVETFPRGSWRLRRFAPALLVALYPVFHAAVASYDFTPLVNLVWLLVCVLTMAGVVAGTRSRETEADLRALELTGNPEALIRALEHLHALVHLPRRRGLDQEARESHPSLANRVQAIRTAAGLTPPARVDADAATGGPRGAGHTLPGSPPTPDALVIGSDPSRAVVFGLEGVAWLSGLQGTPRTADEALGSAREVRRTAYGDLMELRVEARGSRPPALLARDGAGRAHRMEVESEALRPVETALQWAEARLGGAAAAAAGPAAGRRLIRIAGVVTLLAGLATGVAWGVVLAALVVVAWPGTFALVGAGVAALTRTALGPGPLATAISVHPILLGLAGVVLLALAWRRHSAGIDPLLPGLKRPGGVMGTGLLVGILFAVVTSPPGDPAMVAHLWARGGPAALVLLAGLTAALMVAGPRGRSWGWAGVAVLITTGLVSSSWFRSTTADPFNLAPVELSVAEGGWEEVWRASGTGRVQSLRLAPGGERVAVSLLGEDWTQAGTLVLSATHSTLLPGMDAHWSGSSHLAGLDASGPRIVRVDVDGFDTISVPLPEVEIDAWALTADSTEWRLTPRYVDASGIRATRGSWGDSEATVVELPAFSSEDEWAMPVFAGEPAVANLLLYRTDFGNADRLGGRGTVLGGGTGTRIWAGRGTDFTDLGTSALWVECQATSSGLSVHCATPYRSRPEVWVWRPGAELTPVGTLPPGAIYTLFAGDGVQVVYPDGRGILVDPSRTEAWWLPDPPSGIIALDYRDGFLATAETTVAAATADGRLPASTADDHSLNAYEVVIYRR